MKLFLIRHGESEANVAGRINDDPSRQVNLTERGRAQAKAAAEKLHAVRFTRAYVSEFPRARQTAMILLRHHTCPLYIDARINERRTGMDWQPVEAFHGLVHPDPLHIRPKQGESFLEQMERLRSFLDEIAACRKDETVLAVSHENPILAAVALTVDDPVETARGSIGNCEWIELEWPAG